MRLRKLSSNYQPACYDELLSIVAMLMWQRAQGIVQFAKPAGVLAAAGVGVTFSLVTLGLYASFGAGAPISVASPVIRLGGLLLASLAGLVLLQEPLTWRYTLGLVLAGSGIYLIITR